MILKLFVLNAIQTNTWVLTDEETKDTVIIDLGGDYKKVFSYIKEIGGNLKYILCTHGHFDHIMGIPDMQKDGFDIPVYINKNDEELATKHLNDTLHMFGLEGNYPKIKISGYLDSQTELFIGNKKIKVIETPGHTKGGVCFLTDNLLFSGDTLFRREIGRCDLEGGDYGTIINSLKTKLLPLDDDIKVYPGHDASTTMGEEKKYNRYFQ